MNVLMQLALYYDVEPGETPLQAGKRELYELTGITDCTMIPLWDYEQIWVDGKGGSGEDQSDNSIV